MSVVDGGTELVEDALLKCFTPEDVAQATKLCHEEGARPSKLQKVSAFDEKDLKELKTLLGAANCRRMKGEKERLGELMLNATFA